MSLQTRTFNSSDYDKEADLVDEKHEHHEHQHAQHTRHDHAEHHRMMISDFRRRFYVTIALTLPVLALTPFIQEILGFAFGFVGDRFVIFALATVLFFYGGWPFLSGLVRELKQKNPGMMTLIGLAITVSYGYSAAVTFGLDGSPFYWELATLIAIMLAGHWIEMSSVLNASAALEKLAQLMPDEAHRKSGGELQDVPLSGIRTGDLLVVKPGEKIPSDGLIEKGVSYIDESMLTGESRPVRKGEGDRLIGGSINGNGALELRVEGTGEESYLSKVITMVRDAQSAKSKTQTLSDKAAFWLTIVALSVGVITLIAWLFAGMGMQFAITRMATVMVITCPHALGLAIPLVVSVSTSKSAQNGLLIQNRTAFENARKITTVVFDKTGTLTTGTFEVTAIDRYDDQLDEEQILTYAAALETQSEHPVGKSIVSYSKLKNISLETADKFQAIRGKGVSGTIAGREVLVVSPGYLEEQGLPRPENTDHQGTRVFVIVDGRVAGSIVLSDSIRPESRQAVKSLQKRGIKCWMLTGDNRETAEAVANELGMDGFFAEVLPDQKLEKIKELQSDGEYVAMTGDGVNDSPALAQADIGIAVGSGTDVAAATADIILVNSNPGDITALILFGRATYRKMIQNLVWASGYNVVTIPLAAGVLYSAGVVLSPEIGAILMSLSTVIVAINARLLKVKKEELKEA